MRIEKLKQDSARELQAMERKLDVKHGALECLSNLLFVECQKWQAGRWVTRWRGWLIREKAARQFAQLLEEVESARSENQQESVEMARTSKAELESLASGAELLRQRVCAERAAWQNLEVRGLRLGASRRALLVFAAWRACARLALCASKATSLCQRWSAASESAKNLAAQVLAERELALQQLRREEAAACALRVEAADAQAWSVVQWFHAALAAQASEQALLAAWRSWRGACWPGLRRRRGMGLLLRLLVRRGAEEASEQAMTAALRIWRATCRRTLHRRRGMELLLRVLARRTAQEAREASIDKVAFICWRWTAASQGVRNAADQVAAEREELRRAQAALSAAVDVKLRRAP